MLLKLTTNLMEGFLTFSNIKTRLPLRAECEFGVMTRVDIKKTGDVIIDSVDISKLREGTGSTNITLP